MPTTTIAIQLNGREHELPEGRTVAELIAELGFRPGMVAVEVNGSLVTRELRESTILRSGDQVEMVTIMGGG